MAGFKIATGYVEVEVRYDRNRLAKAADAAGADTGNSFANTFGTRVKKTVTRDINKIAPEAGKSFSERFNSAVSRGFERNSKKFLKAFETSFKKPLRSEGKKAAEDWNNSFARSFIRGMTRSGVLAARDFSRNLDKSLRKEVPRAFSNIRRYSRDVTRELGLLGQVSAADFSRRFGQGVQRRFPRTFDIITRQSRPILNRLRAMGQVYGGGLMDGMRSVMPNRMRDIARDFERFGKPVERSFDRAGRRGSFMFSNSFTRTMVRSLSGMGKRVEGFGRPIVERMRYYGDASGKVFGNSFRKVADSHLGNFSRTVVRRIANTGAGFRSIGSRWGSNLMGGLRDRLSKSDDVTKHVKVKVEKDRGIFRRMGFGLGGALVSGFTRTAIQGASSFGEAFSKTMGRSVELTVGALILIIAGLALAMPAIGAAVAGALTLGFAGGIGVLGILAQKESKRVKDAFSDMRKFIVDDFKKISKPMENVLVAFANDVKDAYSELSPALEDFFKTTEGPMKKFQKDILDGFATWGPAIRRSGSAFDALGAKMGPMMRDKIEELGKAFENLFAAVERNPEAVTAVFRFLMDAIIWVIDSITWLTETWAKMRAGWESDWAGLRSIVTGVGTIIAGVFKMIVHVGGGALTALWEMISGIVTGVQKIFEGDIAGGLHRIVEGIFRGFGALFMGFAKALTAAVAAVFGAFGVDTSSWVENTTQFIYTAWNGVLNFFKGIPGAVTGFFSSMWNGVKNVWNGFVGWITGLGSAIWDAIVGVWQAIYIEVVGNSIVPDMVNAVIGWFRNLANWGRTIFNAIKAFILFMWNSTKTVVIIIVSTMVNAVKSLFSGFVNFVRSVFSGLRNFFSTLWSGIRAIWRTVVGSIVAVARTLFSGFVSYVRTIFNGLRGFFSGVWGAIRSIFSTVIRTVTSVGRAIFSSFVSYVRTIFNGLRGFFSSVWSAIRSIWNTLARAVVTVARSVFSSFVSWVRGLFNGLRNFFSSVWAGIRSVWTRAIRSVVSVSRSLFSSFSSFVRSVFNGIRSFFSSVWNAIRNTVTGIVRRLVSAIRNYFSSLGNWIRSTFNSMRSRVVSIWNALRSGIQSIVGRLVSWVRNSFNKFVGWIYDKFNALRKNASNIWNSMRNAIQRIVSRFVSWVRNSFTKFVGWIYDKFNALRKNSSNIWNSMRNAIQRIVSRFVSWVRNSFTKFVGWIYDKWNALRRNSANIWNQMRNAIERVVSRFTKWVRNTFTKFVGWIYDKWNALRRNSVNIWNQMKNGVINKLKDFRNGAMKVVNAFKDGVIKAFDNTKRGVGQAWAGVKRLASEPVKFMVNTVYEKGIRILWSKIADHVKGLGYLKKITLPKGFATGGIMPGYTPGRDVHTVPSHMGPVGLSGGEAIMRPEWTRAVGPDFVNGMNAAARSGGVEAVKRAMTPTLDTPRQYVNKMRKATATREPSPVGVRQNAGYATGGIMPVGKMPGGNFSEGGIFGTVTSALKKKWADIEGGIVNWAKKPFNTLKNSMAEKGGKAKNFPGVPYHMTTNIIDKMMSVFAKQDDEFSDGGGGSAGDVVKLARKSVGKYPESNGNNTNAITRWFGMNGAPWCAMFISWLFNKANASPALMKAKRTAWTGDYYTSGMKKVAEKNSMPGDVAVYGTEHVNLVESKSTRIGGNEGHNVRRSGRKGGTIFRPNWSKAGGAGGGSKNTVMTSFWDPQTASGKRMNAGTISSSVIPLGSKLRVTVGGKSANGTVEDLGPAGFVYKRHHPKALLDLNEIMMQKLTGRRSNTVMGSFKVTKRGSGRTLFGYTNWDGKYSPSKGTKGFATGGIMPGGAPLGTGSHDIGGMLRDNHAAFNRSGEPEMVATLDQFKSIVKAQQNAPTIINVDKLCVDASDFDDMKKVVKFFQDFQRIGRANGGRPQTRVNY